MLDRRTMAAMLAATPFASPLPRLDTPDPRVQPLNTEGVVLFGISPDASVLLGIDDDNRIVFLDANTRMSKSTTDVIPELIMAPETWVSWSPDGNQIAFDLQGWYLQRDSDIFIADVTTGDVTNLTPEGHENEADNLMTEIDVDIDLSPIWLDEDTILFVRQRIDDRDSIACDLCTLRVSNGVVDTILDLAQSGILYVNSRIWRLSDDSLVFLATFRDREIRRGVVMVTPDGVVKDIHPGRLETVNYISVNDTHLIALDVQAFAWWYMALDESMEPTPLEESFPLPDKSHMTVDPILGPEPDSMFTVLRTDDDRLLACLYTEGAPFELGELQGTSGRSVAHWADGYILVAGEQSWLLSQRGPGL